MEDHAEGPASHPEVCKHHVVFAQRVRRRNIGCDLREAILVGEKIEEGEEDGKRLLHAHKAVEGPFPVKLDNVDGSCNALIGDYVLAGIVAFGRAVPEKETEEESWNSLKGARARRGFSYELLWLHDSSLAGRPVIVRGCGRDEGGVDLPQHNCGILAGGLHMMQKLELRASSKPPAEVKGQRADWRETAESS